MGGTRSLRFAVDITALLRGRPSAMLRVAEETHRALPAALQAGEEVTFAWKLSRLRELGRLQRHRRPDVTYRPFSRGTARFLVRADVFHCLRRGGPTRFPGAIIQSVQSLDPLFGQFATSSRAWSETLARELPARDGLFFFTDWARQRFLEMFPYPAERALVVPLGINAAAFQPEPAPEDEAARRRLGVGDRPYVLCIGSISRRKNQARLAQAMARSATARDLDLVLVGPDYAGAEEMREGARRALGERARFMGSLPGHELPGLLRGARAFALPSLYEEQGLVFLEAMACGVPVLGPSLATTRELFGDAAQLAAPDSVEALAAALEPLITDGELRARLRRRGLETVSRFTWAEIARQSTAAYRHIAGLGKLAATGSAPGDHRA